MIEKHILIRKLGIQSDRLTIPANDAISLYNQRLNSLTTTALTSKMKTVLFVCVGNSCRSQIAEAFFNHYAPPGYRAESAGTNPADMVSSTAKTVMFELGIDLGGHRPKRLTEEMLRRAGRIISMGCSSDMCPAQFIKKYQDWGIPDPVGKDINFFREIRDLIQGKVLDLAEQHKANTT